MGCGNSKTSTAPSPESQIRSSDRSPASPRVEHTNNSNSNHVRLDATTNSNTNTNNQNGSRQTYPDSNKTESENTMNANNHVIHPDVKVHAVVSGELDHDHNLAPLGQVTDEQLIAELAERDLDQTSQTSPDYNMNEHFKAMRIPLEAATDDELLAEVDRRRLTLHEDINETLIYETYEMGKVIGHGASGKVFLVTHRENGIEYACKVILKDSKMNDAQSMSTEIEIMKRLRHRNVVTMFELYESPHCLWMMVRAVLSLV